MGDAKYGFFATTSQNAFNDSSLRHLGRSNYGSFSEFYNGRDDLNGLWLNINYSSFDTFGYATVNDSRVSFNGEMFAFFRGQFSRIRNNNGTFEISVGRLKMIEDVTRNDDWYAAKFVSSGDSYYTHPAWRLS